MTARGAGPALVAMLPLGGVVWLAAYWLAGWRGVALCSFAGLVALAWADDAHSDDVQTDPNSPRRRPRYFKPAAQDHGDAA